MDKVIKSLKEHRFFPGVILGMIIGLLIGIFFTQDQSTNTKNENLSTGGQLQTTNQITENLESKSDDIGLAQSGAMVDINNCSVRVYNNKVQISDGSKWVDMGEVNDLAKEDPYVLAIAQKEELKENLRATKTEELKQEDVGEGNNKKEDAKSFMQVASTADSGFKVVTVEEVISMDKKQKDKEKKEKDKDKKPAEQTPATSSQTPASSSPDPTPSSPDPAPSSPDPAPSNPDPAPSSPDPAPLSPDPAPSTPDPAPAEQPASNDGDGEDIDFSDDYE